MIAAPPVVVAGGQSSGRHPDGPGSVQSIAAQGFPGAENGGGGPFAGGAALIQGQRVGNGAGGQGLGHGKGLFAVGVGIEGGVLPGFDRHLGQGAGRRAGFRHIAAHPQGIAGHHVVAADKPLRAVRGGNGYRAARHLFRAKGQSQVINPGRNAPIGLPKGGRAAGTGIFHIDNGNAGQPQAAEGRFPHRHPLIIDMAEVGYRNIPPADAAIVQGGHYRRPGQGCQIFPRKAAKGMQPHADDGHFPARLERSHRAAPFPPAAGRHL